MGGEEREREGGREDAGEQGKREWELSGKGDIDSEIMERMERISGEK